MRDIVAQIDGNSRVRAHDPAASHVRSGEENNLGGSRQEPVIRDSGDQRINSPMLAAERLTDRNLASENARNGGPQIGSIGREASAYANRVGPAFG